MMLAKEPTRVQEWTDSYPSSLLHLRRPNICGLLWSIVHRGVLFLKQPFPLNLSRDFGPAALLD